MPTAARAPTAAAAAARVSLDGSASASPSRATSAARALTVRATEVYFNRDMRNHYSSSVLVGDHLYGFSSAFLTSMKFLTGEVAWRDRAVGKGSVIYAEGHLYTLGEEGTMGLVEATPAGYREKSRFTIAKGELPMWAPPVIANGRLYLRDQDRLFSYDIAAR